MKRTTRRLRQRIQYDENGVECLHQESLNRVQQERSSSTIEDDEQLLTEQHQKQQDELKELRREVLRSQAKLDANVRSWLTGLHSVGFPPWEGTI
jgi:transcription termination factor NusB